MTGPTLADALEYANAGWDILFLRGKIPAIPASQGGHGLLDATRDTEWLRAHWRPGYNIGARVPESLIAIDTDPRHGGEANLMAIAARYGGMPATLTAFSGRGDGGRHRYYIHPGGKVGSKRLPNGVDLKHHAGYCVLPPSIHPATGKPYMWEDVTVTPVKAPAWLIKTLRPETAKAANAVTTTTTNVVGNSDSVADWFTANTTWPEILTGWTEVHGGWRHPTATSPISATVRHDLLFVYTSNTDFEQTEPEAPRGYTRFRAWAVLCHGGDLSAAAKAARAIRDPKQVSA